MGKKRILVTGAGGFIGHHLVKNMVSADLWVRGVDIKKPEYELSPADDFQILDLRDLQNAIEATKDIDQVYALAADMGGMGFIAGNHARIMYNNTMIDFNTLEAARINRVSELLYSSSACVYPEYKQESVDVVGLREVDAYPAQPQDAYGWEKLYAEQLCAHYRNDHGIKTHTVRFHNIFGPLGTWDGGQEKVPAAICRKVANAKLNGSHEIEIWGDGKQTRSFCYIDDCIAGLEKVMLSDFTDPINLGQDRSISIDELADMVAAIAGIKITIRHIPGPQGVRSRNSDNSLLKATFGWEPEVSLEAGLEITYRWIEEQVKKLL